VYSPVSGLCVIQLNELDLGCSSDCDVVGTAVVCVQVEKYFKHMYYAGNNKSELFVH